MKKEILKSFLFVVFILLGAANVSAQNVLAFPGAEGFGRYAVGGRGGTIYHVTNLDDSGSGSFRDAVSSPNRIIVFDVSGVINLTSTLVFSKNLTILGQTAPGEGVQLYGDRVSFSGADNIIVRYMRIRMGIGGTSGKDAAGIANGKNMIFDHVSVLWGRDECFSVSWDNKGTEPTNITIQNSIIGQGLQSHSCGGLIQTNGGVTLFRNLYIENKTRNPKVKGLNQYVNNVVYNWGNGGCYIMGDTEANSWAHIENNYFINGPWDGAAGVFSRGTATFTYYGDGNYVDDNQNGLVDGRLIGHPYSGSTRVNNWDTWDNSTTRPQAHPVIVGMKTAQEALTWIIDSVGPCLPIRDEVDQYLINELISYGKKGTTGGISTERTLPHGGTGALYGGYKPLDSDNDGIPNEWESVHGLNPNDASDASKIANNGYANIENYTFSLHSAYPYVKSPSGLKASNVTKYSIDLTWSDNASNEEGFLLEISENSSNYALLDSIPADSTHYTVSALKEETLYSFRIRSYQGELLSPYSNVTTTATIGDPSLPKACTNPSPAHESTFGVASNLKLSWSNTSNLYGGALTYTIYWGLNPDSLTILASEIASSTYTLTQKLMADTTYYWRVDTKNALGTTQGTLWSIQTAEGGTLFYTDFYTTPTAYYSAYGNIGDNTNIINAANTTKTIGGMTFGTGSNSIRIIAMNGANNASSTSSDYGPYTEKDAGASDRCVQFYTTSSGGYLKLPEVQGPCIITLYAGNPNGSASTFKLNGIISGIEKNLSSFSMATKKRVFKFQYVYEGNDKITFKIDANAKKINLNDVLIEQYTPIVSSDPIAFASTPDTAQVSYADGSMTIEFNQSIRYNGGIKINGEQFEQVSASASGTSLTVSYIGLDAATNYVLSFPEGSLTDYYQTKDFTDDISFSTCDFAPAKISSDTHYGKAALNLPLNFKPFNAVAPFETEGKLIQTAQNDYPHWVQASGGITEESAKITSTSDKLMAYFSERAEMLYLKASYTGSGNVVFKIFETRNPDASPYWRTIRQFSASEFPIDEKFYLNTESRFIKITASTLSSGTIEITTLQLSDAEGNLPLSITPSSLQTDLQWYARDGQLSISPVSLHSAIRLFSLSGTCLLQTTAKQHELQIPIQEGCYLLQVIDGNNSKTYKVIVGRD